MTIQVKHCEDKKTCSHCNGDKFILVGSATMPAFIHCPYCNGTGHIVTEDDE